MWGQPPPAVQPSEVRPLRLPLVPIHARSGNRSARLQLLRPAPSSILSLLAKLGLQIISEVKKCQKLHVRSLRLTPSHCAPQGRITHNPHREGLSPFHACLKTFTPS